MTRESTYFESLRRLRLPMLRPYLESRGWRRAADYKGTLAIFVKGGGSLRQLLVPIRPEFDDFGEQMAQVLAKLADSEGRSERAVLHDLYSGQNDTLRYQVQSPAAARGTLPLEQGISLLEGAKRSLLAAACTVLSPKRTYHPRMSFTPAEEFVDTCELGQTEEGSFSIVLKCPLHFTDDEPAKTEAPFARRATDTLFASVSTLVEAIEGDRMESILNPTPTGVRLTANLCDALIKMQPEAENGSVELSVSWATILPNLQGTPNSVKIRGELFPAIAEVSKRLRGPSAIESAPFLARVDALHGSEMDEFGRRYGEVKLSVMLGDDDEVVRARAMLDVEQYRVADEAHMRNQYVVITGVLNRSSRVATVKAITDFQLMSDHLRGSPPAPRA
jgi:hypothetical protein